MMHVISLGAGVQSTTMALMAAHGEITPMPIAAIFSDTQAEPKKVYEHLHWLQSSNVLPYPVHVVSRGNLADDSLVVKRSKKSGRLYAKNLVPLFMKSPEGSKGILPRRCTSEYKVREIIKATRRLVRTELKEWLRAVRIGQNPNPIVAQWIGISLDESIRKKAAREPWIMNRHPLLELQMTREDCLAWMEKHGYPRPPRSACVFCPYHSDIEWLRLKNEEPDEFAKAVAWERATQDANARDEVTRGKPYLHDGLKPLDQTEFDPTPPKPKEIQLDAFNNECEGMCGV